MGIEDFFIITSNKSVQEYREAPRFVEKSFLSSSITCDARKIIQSKGEINPASRIMVPYAFENVGLDLDIHFGSSQVVANILYGQMNFARKKRFPKLYSRITFLDEIESLISSENEIENKYNSNMTKQTVFDFASKVMIMDSFFPHMFEDDDELLEARIFARQGFYDLGVVMGKIEYIMISDHYEPYTSALVFLKNIHSSKKDRKIVSLNPENADYWDYYPDEISLFEH